MLKQLSLDRGPTRHLQTSLQLNLTEVTNGHRLNLLNDRFLELFRPTFLRSLYSFGSPLLTFTRNSLNAEFPLPPDLVLRFTLSAEFRQCIDRVSVQISKFKLKTGLTIMVRIGPIRHHDRYYAFELVREELRDHLLKTVLRVRRDLITSLFLRILVELI